jgi:uncharacterized protein DUF968
MTQAFQVASTGPYKAKKPVRNPLYKRWIKRFACVACGSTREVDPCHTGDHGLGTKSSDLSCIPLCRKCHDKFDADPRGFAARHRLNIGKLICKFNRLWELKQRRTA